MADVFSVSTRSQIMSNVRSKGNYATEVRLMKVFREHRISGWRRNLNVFGKPDFVFSNARLAVFVDGCFWHNCPMHGSLPKTNRDFWMKKLKRNAERDALVNKQLRLCGWRVLRIWQHEIRESNKVARRVANVLGRRNTVDCKSQIE
jgi:DNA mismatch endonuclease (patch repair protein)